MNFTEDNNAQGSLPQFSELTSRSNVVSNSNYTSGDIVQLHGTQTAVYTTASGPNSTKQQLLAGQINQASKYPGTILAWPDHNTLMQLCEKQALNIPNYTQNTATILSVQPNTLPVRIIPNMYFPAATEAEQSIAVKQETDNTEIENASMESQIQLQHQSLAMAEYFQKLQATTLPLTLQQLIKLQSEQSQFQKKDNKILEVHQKSLEQPQQNILNIPSVPVLRNGQIQNNGNQFISADNMTMITINPNDLNVHIENQDNDSNLQNIKVEQQVQTDSPKTEKKMKFRAKTGEIKVTIALDGSTLYCCPECSLAFPDKGDIEQHIQNHIQERKYQCKECGAMLKRKEHLDQHMRGHSDERPFKCPVCLKAFKRNEHRTRHYVIHSGDKNFTCNVCQKAFSRKDHLNKHTQTHSGIKRTKSKKDAVFVDSKDMMDKIVNATPNKQEQTNFVQKDNSSFTKPDSNFVQHIQNLQKDPNLIQTFSAFKEQALKEGALIQQLAVNMNEILPQNTRYLMPS